MTKYQYQVMAYSPFYLKKKCNFKEIHHLLLYFDREGSLLSDDLRLGGHYGNLGVFC